MKLDLTSTAIGDIVRALRKDKSVSQDQLAQVLDIPRSSVSQIESGSRELSFVEFQKILGLFEVSFNEFISYGKTSIVTTPMKVKSVNRKIKLDRDKFKQLFLYILEKCGSKPNVGETVLYKLLYFCDFNFFEIYEKSLTGMKYKKMQYGPIPDQTLFNPIIKEMRESGMVERLSRSYLNDTLQTRYLNFATADLSVFGTDTEKMIKVVDSVIERLSGMSARQIEDHSHHDYPWQAHEYGEEIDYSSAFLRSGEFANRDYDAMWEQASGSDILKELGEMPEKEYDYYLKLLNNG